MQGLSLETGVKTAVDAVGLTMRRFFWCTRKKKKIQDKTLCLLFCLPESLFVAAGMQAAVDNCPERMHAADAEGPRPPRIETAVEFWSGVEVAAMMQAMKTAVEDTCQERIYAVNAEILTMRFFWCTTFYVFCKASL